MNDLSISHAPRAAHPDDGVALGEGARIHDVATGLSVAYGEWLAQCSLREGRSLAECREQLMNAIARGDLLVEDAGTGA
jgi:hypothetical protein